MTVPGVHHADAAAKVDQPVAVGIGDHRSFRVRHGDRRDGWHTLGNRPGASGEQGAALRTGNLGLKVNDAGH